jgi:putative nucleotidyltransferase with HDIG domain
MDVQEALLLVNQCVTSPSLHMHCIGVGKVTSVIAHALQRSGQMVNVERATLMGLIHDLGRERFNNERHGIEGYKLARGSGITPEVARVCITHITAGRTADAAIAIGLLTESEARSLIEDGIDLAELSLEEQIVCLSDSHVLNGEFVLLAERIAELEARKGPLASEHWYNLIQASKFIERFEQILSYPITDLFNGKKLAEIDFYS